MLLLSHIVDRRVSHLLLKKLYSTMTEKSSFLPKKALVLRKFSRLEYERLCHPNLTEEQLAINLSQRGSVYETLKHYDQVQKSCLLQIESVLTANNIEYLTVDRFGYTEDKISWADVIITSGGDGTFLMAASKVNSRDKPVIGVNSDPTKSVGHLCLPSKYSNNFDKVIELMKLGKFQWQYKQRLRVTLIGEAADEEPKELNDIRYDLRGPINQFLDQDDSQDQTISARSKAPFQHPLPNPIAPGRFQTVLAASSSNRTNSTVIAQENDTRLETTDCKESTTSNNLYPKSPDHYPNSARVNGPNNKQDDTAIHDSPKAQNSSPLASSSSCHSKQSIDYLTGNNGHDASGFNSVAKSFKTVDGRVVYKIRQLKERALNEVFVGETLSARVSYYELSIDNNRMIKMKSSGLTVCTGTGSTSWYYNINKLTEQQMHSILSIINNVTKSTKVQPDDHELVSDITRQFNQTLTFAPTEPIMAYSIRDPVDYASAMGHSHRGHAKRIEVKSRMQNACLVLDGCQFYPFNDGSYALVEMYDEDALKTISME